MRQARVGLIVPSSNTVMEAEFHDHLREWATVTTTRILLEDVTREAEESMLADDLPRALRLLRTTEPVLVVFGCTSAGTLGPLDHDAAIGRRIAVETGARAVTVLGAVLDRLRKIAPRRLAVLTPYVDDLTGSIAQSLAEGGFPPVCAEGMGIRSNLEIGRVTPDAIVRFAAARAQGLAADCLFLSCTNWRGLEAIQPLERKFSCPVISSNQAAIDAVRREIGN